ncbi:MAG: prepilin-type N-terminal cleavage/methylation domain-containing protein [Candidatus Saccharimonadales bacterium]
MNRQKGFTIIEVMLFLAISGGLFFVVMRSTAGTISNVRNDDARESTLSYLQRQYNNVATNNVGRPLKPGERVTCSATKGQDITVSSVATAAGSSDTCVVLGVEIVTTSNPNGFRSYPVLGYANPAEGINSTDSLRKANPVTWRYANQKIPGPDIDRAVSNYTIPWGSRITDTRMMQIPYGDPFFQTKWFFTSIAFLRNPLSGSVDIVFIEDFFGGERVFGALGRDVASSSGGDEQESDLRARRNAPGILCLGYEGGGNRRDAILFNGDGRKQSLTADDITATQGVQGDAYFTNLLAAGLLCDN